MRMSTSKVQFLRAALMVDRIYNKEYLSNDQKLLFYDVARSFYYTHNSSLARIILDIGSPLL